MDKGAKNKVLAMNKKFLSLIVVVLMVFQTITSTAFAQSSTTEENTAATLNETTVAQIGVSVNRKSSSTAYIMYMSPIEDSSETFTAYYAIDKNEQMPSTADMSLWTENGLLPGEDAGWFGITAAGAYPPVLAGLNLSSEYISTNSYNQESFTTDVQPTKGEWKHIKLDIDLFNNEYDVYIDDVKKNTESLPIPGSLSAEGLTFGSRSTNKDTTCCYDNIKLVVDDSVTQIAGKSVYRKSATEAKLYYEANQPGVCRYIINDSKEAPTADNILNNGFSTEQNNGGSISVDIKGLTSGLKYLHFMHQGVNGGNSDIVTIKLPYDYFYTDDFNGYRPGDYPQEFTSRYQKGSIAKVAGDAPHNHAFKQGGSWGSQPVCKIFH